MLASPRGISRAGISFEIFDVARTHVSYILPSLWMNAGVAVGAPTYEVRLFPPMADVLNMAAHKRIMKREAVYFGSFGWSGCALKEVKKIVEPLKWEHSQTFEFDSQPTKEDHKKGEELGRTFAESILRGT